MTTTPFAGPAPDVDRDNPWPGLSSFTEDLRGYFFGREKETEELVRLIRRNTLTVLFGQSGLGKSSLLQAGVFPLLREADFLPLYLRLDHDPASVPLADQVKAALVEAFKLAGADAPAPRADESLWEYFHRKDIDIWSAKNRLLTPVLAFDQFEEIFTLGRADESRRERGRSFLTELADLVENRPPAVLRAKFDSGDMDTARYNFDKPSCQVILSLREDFLPDLEGLKNEMRSLMHNRMRMRRLTGTQALEIVTRPAPHLLADGVAQRVVEFVAGARGGSAERLEEMEVEPSLLSVICRELNQRRRALGQETITADLVSGNRREILNDFYERSVADLPPAMREYIEDHLLTKSGFRDNLALETVLEASGVTRVLVDTLVTRRLLRIEDRLGVQRVELTHDVLAEVIQIARDERQQKLVAAHMDLQARRQRWAIAGLSIVVVALCVGAVFGFRAQRRAEQAARDEAAQSSVTDLIFGSKLLEQGQLSTGLAHLVRAAKTDDTNYSVGTRLISALVARNFAMPIGNPFTLTGEVQGVWFSHLGHRLWTNSADHVLRYFDYDTGKALLSITADGSLNDLAESPDGKLVAAAFKEGKVRVWDTTSGHELPYAFTYKSSIWKIAFSPDSKLLAAGNNDGKVEVWELGTGRLRYSIDMKYWVPSLSFSPDGSLLALCSYDGHARIWRANDGAPASPDLMAIGQANYCQFSLDGKLLVVCDMGGAQLFDVASGGKTGPHLDHDDRSDFAAFSPDGTRLATQSADRAAKVWEVATGKLTIAPLVHKKGLSKVVEWSPDGRLLLTFSWDGPNSAHVWDTRTGLRVVEPIWLGGIATAHFIADGSEVVTVGGDGVRRWSVAGSGARPFHLGPKSGVLHVEMSSDKKAAWVIYSNRLEKIDLKTGRNLCPPHDLPTVPVEVAPPPTEPLRGLRCGANVSPDGNFMAVATANDGIELWDLREPQVTRHALDFKRTSAPLWVVFSNNSLQMVASNDLGQIRIWDTHSAALIASPQDRNGALSEMAFSPDDRLLLITAFPEFQSVFIDPSTGKTVGEPLRQISQVNDAEFSHDGKRIATVGLDGTLRVWDANTHSQVGVKTGVWGAIEVQFNRDDSQILATTGNDLQIIGTNTCTLVTGPLIGGTGYVRESVLSSSGSRAAAANEDGEIYVWGTKSGQLLIEPLRLKARPAHRDRLRDGLILAFDASDGVISCQAGTDELSVWSVPPSSSGQKVPSWLLRLVTVVAGGTLDEKSVFHPSSLPQDDLATVRLELERLPADSPYIEWGRWFLADRATRSIAPGLSIMPQDAERTLPFSETK